MYRIIVFRLVMTLRYFHGSITILLVLSRCAYARVELEHALKRAQQFLSDKHVIAEIGSLFLKQKLTPELFDATDIPTDDAFAKLFGEKHAVKNLTLSRTIESDLILRNVPALRPLNNYLYVLPKEYRKTIHDPWDDILVKSLYCDSTGFDKLDFSILSSVHDGGGGYYDTHQLLGLFMLEENGCYDKTIIANAKEKLVNNIVSALENDTIFSDLYAERVACLFWAGARKRVKPAWIDVIKNAQRDDGGWADIGLKQSGSHPTGLAAVSIKYFLNSDQEPTFYQR